MRTNGNSRESFDDSQEWISEVCTYCPQGVQIMIVGNKVDLEMDARAVSYEEGKKYADERHYEFIETSAKANVKVEDTFKTLVSSILRSSNLDNDVIASHTTVPQQKQESEVVKISNNKSDQKKKDGCC